MGFGRPGTHLKGNMRESFPQLVVLMPIVRVQIAAHCTAEQYRILGTSIATVD